MTIEKEQALKEFFEEFEPLRAIGNLFDNLKINLVYDNEMDNISGIYGMNLWSKDHRTCDIYINKEKTSDLRLEQFLICYHVGEYIYNKNESLYSFLGEEKYVNEEAYLLAQKMYKHIVENDKIIKKTK